MIGGTPESNAMMPTAQQMNAIAGAVHRMLDEPGRWHHGAWGTDDSGAKLDFEDEEMHGEIGKEPKPCRCLCLGAAIKIASGRVLEIDPGQVVADTAEGIAVHYSEMIAIDDPKVRAEIESGEGDTEEPHMDTVIWWNDVPNRTWAEVHALTRKVWAHSAEPAPGAPQ